MNLLEVAADTVRERHRARRFRSLFRTWAVAAARWTRARVIAYRVVYVPAWHALRQRALLSSGRAALVAAVRTWHAWLREVQWNRWTERLRLEWNAHFGYPPGGPPRQWWRDP